MTDHRTAAENDLARAIHALADALAKYARDCPTPDCLLAAGHTGDHDTTEHTLSCGVLGWLASIGARATAVCSLNDGHDGPHHDENLDVDWTTSE
ncbi:hypothetical protein KNV22_gp62 [Gordonia phage Love]|uniref:Uncharacterized protein n=1 Tax=Gordonia phage Love TaxID=2762401 RepID=A0A7G8LKL0_9CAUD|nr:hypothetical protein KNV22_gp62 [Gordonia phage Love]QNJ57782.1 hypothetical protein SEA_LOVE_62 [Gordonia phage Love]